jgi:REP element-mobilizing transposase RayT
MSIKFKGKYRVDSNRASWWDYSIDASYFVTTCTNNRVHWLGEIYKTNLKVDHRLSEIGKIVEEEWIKTPSVRKDMGIRLGEFLVMPNHFHGILIIRNKRAKDAMHRVSTLEKNKFGPQSKNLASIIRGFKSAVTMRARRIEPEFKWQPNYHDHIIHNENEYDRIEEYISLNPENWNEDRLNKKI